jgi:hypothetical protein
MTAAALKAELKDIQSLRALFLQETNFQIRYDSCHERGWTDSYLLMLGKLRVCSGSSFPYPARDTSNAKAMICCFP